jgi:uncharacterized protein (DUF427 family)
MDRVQEWKDRKAKHSNDPLLAVSQTIYSDQNQPSIHQLSSPSVFIATCNGRVVARTSNPQIVNNRIYFPFQDISKEFFVSSPKRWR